ncbi:MAG: hypothetical protein KDD33_04730 [Bdellovibrionales bacterium]|nr:hypothetical protein [Bdellovibrionales bacterium]
MNSVNQWTQSWAHKQNLPCHYQNQVTSTNDLAKQEFAKNGDNFALWVADHQSQGRGREQRSWTDQGQGGELLSTWCYQLGYTPQPILTPLLGLALYKALSPMSDQVINIKPPNDLRVEEMKFAGILVEAQSQGANTRLFIGLGMDVFNALQVDVPTTHLSAFTTVDEASWHSFCDRLKKEMDQAVAKSQTPTLSEDDRALLLKALQNGDSQINKVKQDGSLQVGDQTIDWYRL